MIRRLDKVWFVVLGRAQRWILCRVSAHCRREVVRGAKGEALRRLERALASQKPHLN